MIDTLSDWLTGRLRAVVLAFAAAGFIVLLAELLAMDHDEGKQVIALVAVSLGALLSLGGLVARGRLVGWLAGVLVVLALSGPVGAYFHWVGDDDSDEARTSIRRRVAHVAPPGLAASDDSRDEADKDKHQDEDEKRPPFAPFGVSGLAALAAVGVLVRRPA